VADRDEFSPSDKEIWKRLSEAAWLIDAVLSGPVYLLLRLDQRLRDWDSEIKKLADLAAASPEVSERQDDHRTLAYLWVLGSYEVLRAMDQRLAGSASTVSPSVAALVNTTKRRFGEVRMPLAKLEARGDPKTKSVAVPELRLGVGLLWRLQSHSQITRDELSKAFRLVMKRLDEARTPTEGQA
jgi:hypothetical protein